MTTDTDKIRKKFERDQKNQPTDLEKDRDGYYLDTFTIGLFGIYERAYKQGQRDLIEAMGEPVAWVSVHKNFTGCTTNKHNAEGWMRDKSGEVFPTYRLPEDTPK